MRHRFGPAAAAMAVAIRLAAPAWGQYPAQYPPGQYPPGQYPPNTYPPGSYPPNTYPPNSVPVRLPGGVPVGIPMPEPKLPKKKDSKSADEARTTIASVDGTLRKLGEKDLVLGARKGLLRFRLLGKTRFLNPKGESVRDSLLHPGDLLSVGVSPDDAETALRVILVRSGTDAERTAAERPFDPDTVRPPRSEDLGKPRTVTAREATPDAGAGNTEPEAASSSGAAAASGAPSGAAPGHPPDNVPDNSLPAPPDLRPKTDAAVIGDARTESTNFSESLPNYLVQQATTRYYATGLPARWQEIDVVTAELAYVNGKENYHDFRINGRETDRPIESTGAWSTGEFGTTLNHVMSPYTNASFRRRGEEKTGGRQAFVFDYTVAQPNSHWTLVAPDGRRYNPAYEGAVWIDAATRRVLRLEMRATVLPRDFAISRAESILEYGFVKIEQVAYLLPTRSENTGCMSGSGTCTRNAIEFRNYRKFTAESTVSFEK
jgi:hypothetical protein